MQQYEGRDHRFCLQTYPIPISRDYVLPLSRLSKPSNSSAQPRTVVYNAMITDVPKRLSTGRVVFSCFSIIPGNLQLYFDTPRVFSYSCLGHMASELLLSLLFPVMGTRLISKSSGSHYGGLCWSICFLSAKPPYMATLAPDGKVYTGMLTDLHFFHPRGLEQRTFSSGSSSRSTAMVCS